MGVSVGSGVWEASDEAEGVGSDGCSLAWAIEDGLGLAVAVGLPSVAAARPITSAVALMAPIAAMAVFRFNVVAPPSQAMGAVGWSGWSRLITAWRRIAEVDATGS